MTSLLAVHISDQVLTAPWWLTGFAVMGVLAFLGAWKVRDEEIPTIALLTAAFFVITLVHIPVGPTRAHLLFNGLLGVLLGRRAALAIPIGVFLQAVLLGHGGFTTIGINSCLMVLPALAAAGVFSLLKPVSWARRPWSRRVLVATSSLIWILSLVCSLTLAWIIFSDPAIRGSLGDPDEVIGLVEKGLAVTFHPLILAAALALSTLAAWGESKLKHAPEFPLGLLIGELAVLGTVALNFCVLLLGGENNWTYPAVLEVVFHLPIAVVEGIVLGFTLGLVARVRPDILGMNNPHPDNFPAETNVDGVVESQVVSSPPGLAGVPVDGHSCPGAPA